MTFDPDVAPQKHVSNDEVLLTYEEFEEALLRFAKTKSRDKEADLRDTMVPLIEDLFREIAMKMPGRHLHSHPLIYPRLGLG